jgi:hypothetical protein
MAESTTMPGTLNSYIALTLNSSKLYTSSQKNRALKIPSIRLIYFCDCSFSFFSDTRPLQRQGVSPHSGVDRGIVVALKIFFCI